MKDLVTEKGATRTIKYVDRNGKEVTETRVETIKFTRDAKINLVTGEITYGEWTTDRNDDIFNGYPVPVVKGYIAKDGDLESSTKDVKVTPDTIKDINETVVYDKLGSWVPNIPGTPTNPIPYPNDPKIQQNQEAINQSFLTCLDTLQWYLKIQQNQLDQITH